MKKNETRFIIKKYVMAKDAAGALRKEKLVGVHECYVDVDFQNKLDAKTVEGFKITK